MWNTMYDEYEDDWDEGYETQYPVYEYDEASLSNLEEVIKDRHTSDSMSILDLVEQCMTPTVMSVGKYAVHLVACCLLFRLTILIGSIPVILKHVVSFVLGIYLIFYFSESFVIRLIIPPILCYFLHLVLDTLQVSQGTIISLIMFSFMVFDEFLLDSQAAMTIRGTKMFIAMKIVSLAYDLDSRVVKKLPKPWEYGGYIFFVGNTVLGVWCPYNDYLTLLVNPPILNFNWSKKAGCSYLLALTFLVLSDCFFEWLIPTSRAFELLSSALWWIMYRRAIVFRTGHYFACYLSEVTAVLSGLGAQSDGQWCLTVCEPSHIELPHSLVEVVIYWNKNMHKWLKQYVFKTWSKYGGLVAVLATYFVSSLLHGLNYPLAAILMSLGFYTYVEYSVRHQLSVIFDACVSARPCPNNCSRHKHTARLLPVAIINWFWSALAIFHLAYLGCIVPQNYVPISILESFQLWGEAYYISHFIASVTFLFNFYLKHLQTCWN